MQVCRIPACDRFGALDLPLPDCITTRDLVPSCPCIPLIGSLGPEALADPIWPQLPAGTTKNVIPWDLEPLLTYTTVTTFARTPTTFLT